MAIGKVLGEERDLFALINLFYPIYIVALLLQTKAEIVGLLACRGEMARLDETC